MIDVLKDLVVEQTTNHLQQEEDRLDNMMQKLDNMDEDDLEKMREVRKRRMQKEAAEKHKLRMKTSSALFGRRRKTPPRRKLQRKK